MDSTSTATHENMKKAYADKFDAQLKSLGADIDKLKAKAQGATADLRVTINKQLEEFHVKQEAARVKFEEYKAAGSDKMDGLKAGLEKAWQDLRSSVDHSLKG
jgi:hypothetical protein